MNYIVLGSFLISLSGLVLIYIAASNFEPQILHLEEINSELIGTTVTTEGVIKSKTIHDKGHMFLTIVKDDADLQVPVFSSVMQHVDHRKFKKKSTIRVTGVVDEYRKSLQIIPRKPEDIDLV